jgi:isoleucyl-tRNA synthetase
VILPLWNTWSFFALYANAAAGGKGIHAHAIGAEDIAQLSDLDRYILARTRTLVERLTASMDGFEIPEACEAIREHLDILTNWYVRRSRDRFWAEDPAAFATLYTALEILTRVIAPLAPLVAEEIWRGLTGGHSVHLTDWPDISETGAENSCLPANPELVSAMDQVREVCSLALSLRKAHSLRVRQPLRRLTVVTPNARALEPFTDLVAGEVNVREVIITPLTDDAAAHHGIVTRLDVNARVAGPRLGRAVQGVIQAAKAGMWDETSGSVIVHTRDGDVDLRDGEFSTSTVIQGGDDQERAAAILAGGGFVVLDTALDADLISEGHARDLIRLVQDARKAAGLDVTDRIDLRLAVPSEMAEAVTTHAAFIQAETLATTLTLDPVESDQPQATVHRTPR